MLISLVIATFNEAENISSLWKRLRDVGEMMPQHHFEVVFTDDGSVDETVALLTRQRVPLCGNARRLREATGWQPTVSFQQMLETLLEARQNG